MHLAINQDDAPAEAAAAAAEAAAAAAAAAEAEAAAAATAAAATAAVNVYPFTNKCDTTSASHDLDGDSSQFDCKKFSN